MNRILKAIDTIGRFSKRLGRFTGTLAYLKIALFKRLPGPDNRVISLRIPQLRSRVYLRPKTTDAHAFWQVFVGGDYDFPVNKHPGFIVDAGAHIGLATLYFLHRFPQACILAVEPEPSNADVFVKNTSAYHNVNLHRAALWSEHKLLNIENPDADSWSFRVQETGNRSGGVNAITIADILDKNSFIDILKLDIEGAEMELFSGDNTWLKQVGLVILEFHEHYSPGSTEMIKSVMKDYGFRKVLEQGENVIFEASQSSAT